MLVQVTLLTECFLTKVTLEWSVTGVCPHVRLKIRFLRELLSTNLAAVCVPLLLRTVNTRVYLENLHCLETLLTHIALEVFPLPVDKVMPLLQVFWRIELAAVLALHQQVLVYEVLPPVSLDLGHSGAEVVTPCPVTPDVTLVTMTSLHYLLTCTQCWTPDARLPSVPGSPRVLQTPGHTLHT